MVLVTGASGFVGQQLVRYLSAQGVQVRALYNRHMPTGELAQLPSVAWMQCDLLDVYAVTEALNGISDVYHCAAVVSFDPRRRNEILHFNTESTANLVNEALEQNIRKMVYVSSIAALGRSGNEEKEITEEQEWGESKYNSAYGISKYLGETEVWRGIGEGLNAVIVNPGIILGPTTGRDLSAGLMKMAWREFPFYSGGVNSWVDMDDLIKIMVTLMASDIEGERFIVSNGNHGYREILELMAQALNKKPPRYSVSPLLAGIMWRLLKIQSTITGKTPMITRETANNANARCYYNNSKLLNALPGLAYKPIRESIDGMARSFIHTYKK